MGKPLSERHCSPEVAKDGKRIGNTSTKSLASKNPGVAAKCLKMIEKHCGKAFAQCVKLN